MVDKNGCKIFYNGTIYTNFSPLKKVESIVTKGSRIEFSGSGEEAMRLYGNNSNSMVNLEGKVVIPGFVDSHIHLDDLGASLNYMDLRGIDSIEAMKERVSDYHLKNPHTRVIIGYGWDQESFSEGRWPNRWDLDEVENALPVFLQRFCEHAGVVNSRMLELLRDNKFPDTIFPHSSDGRLSGVVKEEALAYFKEKAMNLAGNLERNLVSATQHLLSIGVTSVGFVSCSKESIDFLLAEGPKLGLRLHVYLNEDISEKFEEIASSIVDNPFLHVSGIKLFADGALGAGTASLRAPYSDDPSNSGILYLDSEKLVGIFEKFQGRRPQFAIHAIGDRGIDAVIDAVSKFGREKLMEPRIEHCTVLRDGQVQKLKELDIGVSTQPAFVIDDWWAVKRLGKERCKIAYPLATLHNSKIRLGLSTDSPVEPPEPWFSIDAAVNRGEKEGREILKYSPGEKVDLLTAMSLYTTGSARLLMDNEIGTLEPGKFADFVVLDRDPFATRDIRNIKAIETVVGGNSRFKSV